MRAKIFSAFLITVFYAVNVSIGFAQATTTGTSTEIINPEQIVNSFLQNLENAKANTVELIEIPVSTTTADAESVYLEKAKKVKEEFKNRERQRDEISVDLLLRERSKKVKEGELEETEDLKLRKLAEKENKKILNKEEKIKFKNKNLKKEDKEKIADKVEQLKNEGYSTTLDSEIKNFKTKNKGKKDKKVTDLKNLNEKIKTEFNNKLRSKLTKQEQNEIQDVEANVLFELEQSVYVPLDPQTNTSWSTNAVISEYPGIFSTVSTLERPVVVAVIDAGVDYNHEDLAGRMWSSYSCVNAQNQEIVGGCTNGYDFVTNDNDPLPADNSTHGTAVAGLIGASTDNNKGISSFSQNRVQIMSLRVADNGYIQLDSLVNAVYFAIYNNADVINMSLSGPTYSQNLFDALKLASDRGIKVVVSAGNYGLNLETTKMYPASYVLPNIFVVGSMDEDGAYSSFSNYGISTVDVVAPGKNVLTTTPGNNYTSVTGTSFSAPIFTAIVSRWISENKDVQNELTALKTNPNYLNKTLGGKTLAWSSSNSVSPAQEILPRYTDLGNGTFLDTQAKGGEVVSSANVGSLQAWVDTSIGMPYQISPGYSSLSGAQANPLSSTCQTFYWQSAAGAKIYGLYITNNDTGVSFHFSNNEGMNTSKYLCGFTQGTTYRWNTGAGKVNASSPYNVPPVWYFKIAGANPTPPPATPQPPGTPTGLNPSPTTGPGQLITTTSLNLSWNTVSGATYYGLGVRDLSTNQLIVDTTVLSNSYTVSNLQNGRQYRFNMNACNSAGCSSFATPAYFYIQLPVSNNTPSVPVVTLPASVNKNVMATFQIRSSDSDVDNTVKYDIDWGDGQVQTTSYFAQNVTQNVGHTYQNAGTYCVRARATDNKFQSNSTSNYSSCQNYIVNNIVTNADLVVSAMNSIPNTYKPGDTISNYPYTVTNQGGTQTANSYKTSFYLNAISVGTLLGEVVHTSLLPAGSSENKTVNLVLPPQTNSVYTGTGNYTVYAVVDSASQVTESNENNNGTNYKTVSLNMGGNITINNIGAQVSGVAFPITINTTNIPVGTKINISTGNGQLGNISSFNLDKTGQTSFMYRLDNISYNQQIYLSPVGSNGTYSNKFDVAAQPGTLPGVTTTYYGGIDLKVVDALKTGVANVNVEASCLNNDCAGSVVTKVTNSTGNVTFTGHDLASLSQQITLKFKAVSPAVEKNINVTRNVGTSVFRNVEFYRTVDSTHNPVILVPGIMGSTIGSEKKLIPLLSNTNPKYDELYIADGTGAWGYNSDPDLYVGGFMPLGWEGLRSTLESYGYVRNQTIIDCPYDWRNSVEKSALTYFARCVEEAQRLNPGKKVDVIAHSMGGLVTRAYIQQNDGGTNAQKINKIFFVGTPQEGATDAYYAWEGGDSRNTVREWVIDGTYKLVEGRDLASVVHDATLKKLKEMQVTPNEIQFVQEIKLQKQKEVKRFFEEHKVLGVKQLLPTYKFLDAVPNGTSTDVDRLSVDKNKNEFLIALNKYTDYSCGNNLCDEGAHLKPSYNFSTLQQAKTWGNLTMKMFYANKPERFLGVGPITNEAATKHIVNVTNTPYPYGLYEDGVPWTVGPDVFSKGDGTVPEVSTKIFSQNSGGAISLSAEKEGEHAALPRVFQSELAAEMAGHAMLATLQNVATVTARMNVHTLGNVSVKLAAQTGEVVGIDEGTKTGVQTFTNVENLNIGQNSSIITLSEPTANQYTLKVFGEESGPVDVYIDYVNQTTGKMNSFNFTVYHDKTRVENIKFTLNPTATTNEELIVLDGRLTRELENVKVVNTNGKTYVTLTAFTMGSSPIWYRLYSKLPNESRYQFVSQVQVQTYGNIPTNFDFAGPNEAITRQFRLSAVYSDNTESALGKVYENNDSDWDGLTDIKEINLLTNPLVEDTDKDGLTDGIEVMITGTDPTKKDTDNNGVEDYEQNKTKYNLKDRVPETLPAGIVANSYYKFDGVLGSVDKKKDQMRAEGAITEYSILSSVGRTGIADSSYTFSGGRAQLDAPVVLTNNPMTYSFWVKTTQSEFARMLSMNANGSRNFFDINIYAGKLNIELGSNQNIGFAGTKVVNDNVWHKVDVTIRNNPNVEIKTYVDGVYDVGVGGSGHFLASNLNGKINLGVAQNWLYPETYQSHFSGSIDDLKIYDRVLTATEIQSEYNLDIGVANTTPNVPPVLFLKGDTEMLIYKNTSWQDPGANAFDMEDGNISGLIQISGTVNTNIVGTTTLTYSVSDSKYATTTKARYVSVIDSLVNISTSTATSTSGLPVPIAEYKADGPIGSVEKTRDEKRVDKSITEVSMLTGSGIKEQANTAYQFGGSGRASFEAPKILTNTAMTYSLWVKTNQGGFARLLSMNANGSRNFLDININAGKTNFEIGSSQNLGLQGVKTINDNIWHKIDLTIENNPNATIKIYVDGLLDNSVTGTGPFTASNINNKINLGVAQNWDNATLYQSYFSGSMDEVRIYDKVLSATEIKGMYDADLDLPNTAPTLALIGSDTMSIFKGDIYTELGATASDAEEGNLTTSIVITGTVDVNTVGQYSLVYKVTDSKGLTVSKTRTVNVVSKPLPDIYSQFKFNGSLGSAGKKVDTILPTNSVTTESEVLSDADRNGEVDGSYKTVGGTSHILLTNSKIVTDQSMTYSFWVKSGQTSGTGSVFAYNSSNQTRNFFNVWLSNGRIYPELAWISDSGSYMWVQPNTAIKNVSDNKWHKVDIVIQNNPNAEIRSYIDGQLESTTNASSPYRLQSIESLVRFGVVKNWSTFALEAPFIGSVDDFRVYDKALTSAEVSAVYSDDKTSMLSSFTLDEAVSGGSLVPVEIDRTGFPEGYGVLEVRPGSSHPIGVTSNQAVQAETMSTTTEPYTRTNTD